MDPKSDDRGEQKEFSNPQDVVFVNTQLILKAMQNVQKAQQDFCLLYTSENTHAVIRANLDRSPLYSGVIEGIGPRYCPSIEDKVVRFADKPRHQLFIEPMGLDLSLIHI